MLRAVLLVLAIYLPCSVAQNTVTQDATMSVSLGGNAQLSCRISGGSVSGGNYPAWVHQIPGTKPKHVVGSYGTGNQNYNPASPRYTGSISGASAVLTITNVQTEDEGTFYCYLLIGNAVIFGGGTQLTVLTGEVKVPSVFIYPPSEEELKTNSATVVCTASNYRPSPATMEFLVDGQKLTNGVYTSPVAKQSDSSYMGSSFLTMTASDYNKYKEYSCKVTHQGKEFIQILKRSECF